MYGHERSLVNSMKGRPFALLGVNTDKNIGIAKTAIAENELNWRSWYDGQGGSIVRQFQIRSFPTILILDHNGLIRFKNIRGTTLDTAIEELVSDAEKAGMSGVPVETAEFRNFTTADRKYKVEAAYQKFEDCKLFLKRKDNGKIIEIEMKVLSKEDQQYIREFRRSLAG